MRNSSRTNGLLLLTLGATLGVVAGALLADRLGGVDRLLSRRRLAEPDGTGELDYPEGPYGLHDADGSYEDEDDELAPESIAHIHMLGRDSARDRFAAQSSGPDLLTLEARVLEAFHNDPVLRERAIDIGAIAQGVIELTGWVHADSEVQHAVTIARGVPDVFHVVDQLAVRKPSRARRATDPRPSAELADARSATPPSST